MAAHLFKRYVWLLDQISRGGMKYEDINNLWRNNYRLNERKEPLPVRTLQRHIKAIENMFGIEIECDRRDNNRYKVVGEGGGELSPTQETLIAHLRMTNLRLDDSLQPYLILPTLYVNKYVSIVAEAITKFQKVKVLWGWEHEGEEGMPYRWVKVSPYYVKGCNSFSEKGNSWYIIGADDKGEIVAYNLDTIKDLEVLDETFQHPEIPLTELMEHFKHSPMNDQDDSFGLVIDYQ